MRNNRFSRITLAASALGIALIAGNAGGASAADYDGPYNGRVEYGTKYSRGDGPDYRDRDFDRGPRHGGWNGNRDRHFGHRHWRGRYKPWWRYSRDAYYDRYEPPHRHHWWNRY